jgi:TolA-binding protein
MAVFPLHAQQDDPEVTFKAGVAAFQSGDYPTAIKDFESVLSEGPQGDGLETLLLCLGSAYFNQKDLVNAEKYYTRSLQEFPAGKNKTKVLLALSQIQSQTGRKEEAAKTLQEASEGSTGEMAGQARIAEATLLSGMGKPDEAAAALRPLVAGGIKDGTSAQAAMELTEILSKAGYIDEARSLLEQLQLHSDLVDNPLLLDFLAVGIGDALLKKNETKKALTMYSIVRPKAMVIELQKARITAVEKQIADNRSSLQLNPKAFMEVRAVNDRLTSRKEELKSSLAQFEKSPDTDVPIRIREAKAYDDLDQKWESILIWETLLDSGDPKTREDGLYSIANAYAALALPEETSASIGKYMAEFPTGKYASQAGYLNGAVAMESGNWAGAETAFGYLIKKGNAGALYEDAFFLMANSQFAQASDPVTPVPSKYKDALANYKTYMEKFPNGKFAEEVSYRLPLTSFQIGDYGAALDAFQAFEKKYPHSEYAGDVGYRIALCYHAANRDDDVIKLCNDWLRMHKGESMEAEVLALLGDAYAAKEGMSKESAASYRAAVEATDREEVQKYALFEACKQYQKINDWESISDMFTKFTQQNPDSPMVVAAVFWVSKAKVKQGKITEAKLFLGKNIQSTINDRKKDAVEQLLTQLAQLCSKRPRAPLVAALPSPAVTNVVSTNMVTTNNTSTSAAETPRPTPTPLPPYDAASDLAKYLNDKNAGETPLALARLRFTQAQLAGMTKQPEKQKDLMASIYRDFQADQLSAYLLSECGNVALAKGDPAKAGDFYQELIKSFPKSDLLEYAYCGMGNVALAEKKPDQALKWFTEAVEKTSAEAKLADITYGKGRALLELGNLDEANKTLQEVAGNKEWRGEVTAKALLSLGDLENRRGNIAAGIQYYQRVFVAYQRYVSVVSEAYLKAADGFIKLGQLDKAAAHLREMLSKPRLAATPEAAEARKKLEGLPAEPAASPGSASSPTGSPSATPAPSTP